MPGDEAKLSLRTRHVSGRYYPKFPFLGTEEGEQIIVLFDAPSKTNGNSNDANVETETEGGVTGKYRKGGEHTTVRHVRMQTTFPPLSDFPVSSSNPYGTYARLASRHSWCVARI